MIAYTRVSGQEICIRFGIYHPDCLIILDPSLTKHQDITSGLKEGHWIIMNSDKKPGDYPPLNIYRVATVDANSIARKYGLGSPSMPIINTTILGAFPKVTEKVSIDSVLEAIRENSPSKPEKNARAALDAYGAVIF